VLAVLDLPVAAVVGEQVGWVRLLRGAAGDPVDMNSASIRGLTCSTGVSGPRWSVSRASVKT